MASFAPQCAAAEELVLGGGDQAFTYGAVGGAIDPDFTFTSYSPTVVIVTDSTGTGQFTVSNNADVLGDTTLGGSGTFTVGDAGDNTITAEVIASSGSGTGTISGYSLYIDPSQTSFDQNDPAAQQSTITFNGGILKPTGGSEVTFSNPITVQATGGTVDTSEADTVLSGAITADGTFAKTGTGTLTVSGGATFLDLVNEAGTLAFSGSQSVTASSVTNQQDATMSVGDQVTVTVSGSAENGGRLEVLDGGTFSAGGLTNTNTGEVVVYAGGRLVDDLDNAGTVTNAGTYEARVNSNTGTITNDGTWTGNVGANSNQITNQNGGTWTGDVEANGGTIENSSGSGWSGAVQGNSGTITSTGAGSTWQGAVEANGSAIENFDGSAWTGDVEANLGTITNDGTDTTWSGAVTTNGGTITNQNSATWTGDVAANASVIVNDSGATWNGAVASNTSSITNQGGATWNGAVDGNSGLITNTGTDTAWVGDATNSATITNSDGATWTGELKTNSGIVTTSGGSAWTGAVSGNTGTVYNQTASTWTGAVTDNEGIVQNSGESSWVDGAVTNNQGTITNTGENTSWAGEVVSNTGGVIVNDETASWTGAVTANTGTIYNQNGSTWTGDVASNEGSIANTTASSWSGAVTNYGAGTIVNDGAGSTWTGDVAANAGLIYNQNEASWTGDVLYNQGTISNSGTWTGAADNTAGTLITTGAWVGDITNSAILLASGTVTGSVTNAVGGWTQLDGNLAVSGSFTNASTITMSQGTASYGTLSVGSLAASDSSTVIMDIDLSASSASTQRSDMIVAGDGTGAITGTTTLQFVNAGGQGLFAHDIVVVEGVGDDSAFTTTSLGSSGLVNYKLVHVAKEDEWVVRSTLNPVAGGFAGTMATTLTTMTAGFIQSVHDVVQDPVDPVADKHSYDLWVRLRGGSYNMSNTASTQVVGSTVSVASADSYQSSYGGFQVGADFSYANIGGSGWNSHLGITAGSVWINNKNQGVGASSDVTVPIVGAYATVSGHNLFADLQVLYAGYNSNVSLSRAGLVSVGSNTGGWIVSANVGGTVPFSGKWFLEPSAGLTYASAEAAAIALADGETTIGTDAMDSTMGHMKVRVGTRIDAGKNVVLRPVMEASLWHEFSGGGTGTYWDGQGGSALFSVTGVGTFGGVGIGLTGEMTDIGVKGFVRADYQFGENIDGGSFSGGLSTQF